MDAPIPEDLKEMYEAWQDSDSLTAYQVVPLIERIASLEELRRQLFGVGAFH